jgi:Tfp pilus assembly protein PilV
MARTPRRKDLIMRVVARACVGRDTGMTIIEICVASMLLTIVLIGVVGSMGAGLSFVGQSRQRSVGVTVAEQAMESVHKIPYTQVGLSSAPPHSADTSNPDYYVTGSTYDPDGSGPRPSSRPRA